MNDSVKKVSYYETDFGIVTFPGGSDLMGNLFIKPDYRKERKKYLNWKKSSKQIEGGINTLAEGIYRTGHTLNSISIG